MPGIIGAFEHIDAAVDAIGDLRRNKYNHLTVYTPTPRHEFEHALEAPPSRVRLFTLIGGLAGVTFGYWIAVWASRYWPIIVGNKPIASWVPFGIGMGIFLSADWALMADVIPKETAGRYMGILNAGTAMAGPVFIIVAGPIQDLVAATVSDPAGPRAAMLVAVAFLAMSALALTRVDPRRRELAAA